MKNNTKKNHWFYMEPYVHLEANDGNALVYNALNGNIAEYDNPAILDLVNKLKSKKNSYAVALSDDQLAEPAVSAFVEEMKTSYSGDLIDAS